MKKSVRIGALVVLSVLIIVLGVFFGFHANAKTLPKDDFKKVIVRNVRIEKDAVVEEDVLPHEESEVVVQEVSYEQEEDNSSYSYNSIVIPGVLENSLMSDSGDNFYLNHNINGVYDGRGVPYVDFRNDFTGRKTIIYAHSTLNGNGPFQALQNYHYNRSYYDSHPYITINYNGNTYTYLIFSVYVSLADSDDSEGLEYFYNMDYSDSEWQDALNRYKSNSEYDTGVSVSSSDKILILQTCSMDPNFYEKYYRYNLLIMGKLV